MSEIKLWQGDCLELMKQIPDNSIDLIVTDPPYGMKFQSHRRKNVYNKIHNDNDLYFLNDFLEESYRVMNDNTAIYVFCSWHNVDTFKSAFEKHFKLKNILVWVKNNHGSGDLQASYAPKHEFILYGNKGRRKFESGRNEDVLCFNKTQNALHPTQKPVDLLAFLMQNSSQENAIVLDPFMGSGSTGVACVNTNRNFIGIELDENYFNIAKERIEKAEKEKCSENLSLF